jgi:hypothetical protein
MLKRHGFGKTVVAQWMSRNAHEENEDTNAHSFS